jgi:prepilin-type N-terminal cleavage/methylation domain-containing protein
MSDRFSHRRGYGWVARAGFTLLEVVVSIAILAILLAGVGSATFLARRAVPDGKRGASAVVANATVSEPLVSDLTYATKILGAPTATSLTFTNCRGPNGQLQTVRYSWSGVAGDPLKRWTNPGEDQTFLPEKAQTVRGNVREFHLDLQKQRIMLPQTSDSVEGGEQLLISYDSTLANSYASIDSGNFRGQIFQPVLPSDAVSWKVTKVAVKVRSSGYTNETTKVQLRLANGNIPGSAILEERSFSESSLDWYYFQWKQISFTSVSGLPPGIPLCLVLVGSSSSNSCDVLYHSAQATGANSHYVGSSSGESGWYYVPQHDLLFAVYGKVTSPKPATYKDVYTNVRCTLRSDGTSWPIETTVRLVNEPTVDGSQGTTP